MKSRAQNVPAVLRLLLGFVVLSTVGGLLLAGLVIPAVGATGQAAKGGVDFFNELPSQFTVSPLAQQSRILDADGKLIANPYDENRIIKPLKKIAPVMQKAQIAIEDARFYEHGGLDPRGFTRALVSNLKGGEVQGASTLTQQYVKITLQEQALRRGDEEGAAAAVDKNYARKLQELKYAINVEENYTKDQILEGYLNLVYYGDQAYGVEAAALNYFGVHASKLKLGQAALMAGIVQQPTKYNPVLNPEDAQARRDVVLNRMEALGFASAQDVAKAKKQDVKDMIKKKEPKGVCHRSRQPFFCAYVLAWLQNSPQMEVLGKTPEERLKRINQGGLTIRTTLKPDMQKAAQKEIERAAPIGNKSNIGGAITTVEPGTGKILVMAQASDFDEYQTNVNVDQEFGGGPYGYQYGSIAKTFAVVTALEEGMPLEGKIKVPYADTKKAHTFTGSEVVNAPCGSNEPWEVTNDFPSGGKYMTLKQGLSQSINTWAAQLVIDVGPCKVHDLTTDLGVHMANGDEILPTISNITLGSGSTTPMAIASAYAVFASGGKYCEPYPVTSITAPDEQGKKQDIEVPGPQCDQVIDSDVAAGITWMLEETLRSGTAAGIWDVNARPAAGKTGTTEKFNQSWFVGYTRQLSTAVWVGNVKVADKNGNLYTLAGKCFGDYGCHSDVFGSTVAAPVWATVMKEMSAGMDVKGFKSPSADLRRGDTSKWPQPGYTQPTYTQPTTQATTQPDPQPDPQTTSDPKPKNTPPPKRD